MSNKRIVIVGRIRTTSFVSFTTGLSDWRKSKFENIWKYSENNQEIIEENGKAEKIVVAAAFNDSEIFAVFTLTFL